ncbi:MAG: hypothetical protein NVSMB51_11160 [Solirubrobacteraceae bacterium]
MSSPVAHLQRSYEEHFEDSHPRERLFVSTVGFLSTFAVTRAITHAIKNDVGPFHDVGGKGGPHIHHMTFGIIGNLIVGYLWVMQVGTHREPSPVASRATALLFGAGAALTLDEFALWLNLEDDYWSDKGRESIDAVVVFGSLLGLGALGGGILTRFAKRLREAL